MIQIEAGAKPWAMGDSYTMADCAASPAIFYGHMAMPFDKTHPNVFAYRQRLMERPTLCARTEGSRTLFCAIAQIAERIGASLVRSMQCLSGRRAYRAPGRRA